MKRYRVVSRCRFCNGIIDGFVSRLMSKKDAENKKLYLKVSTAFLSPKECEHCKNKFVNTDGDKYGVYNFDVFIEKDKREINKGDNNEHKKDN